MKNPAELSYLRQAVGEQLLPHFAQRRQLRRSIPLINLPKLGWFKRVPNSAQGTISDEHLPHRA